MRGNDGRGGWEGRMGKERRKEMRLQSLVCVVKVWSLINDWQGFVTRGCNPSSYSVLNCCSLFVVVGEGRQNYTWRG